MVPALHHPLPTEIVQGYMLVAKPHKGYEGAGPAAHCDFSPSKVFGLMKHHGAVNSLVVMVPSTDAFPRQDPRVRATSLTFQPSLGSSLHVNSDGIFPGTGQLPRVLIPCQAQACEVEHVIEATVWCVRNGRQLYLIKWKHLKEPTW